MIVLDESGTDTRLGEAVHAKCLHKETALVAKNLGTNQDNIRDICGDEFHVDGILAYSPRRPLRGSIAATLQSLAPYCYWQGFPL